MHRAAHMLFTSADPYLDEQRAVECNAGLTALFGVGVLPGTSTGSGSGTGTSSSVVILQLARA
jgi:hypothetical protein